MKYDRGWSVALFFQNGKHNGTDIRTGYIKQNDVVCSISKYTYSQNIRLWFNKKLPLNGIILLIFQIIPWVVGRAHCNNVHFALLCFTINKIVQCLWIFNFFKMMQLPCMDVAPAVIGYASPRSIISTGIYLFSTWHLLSIAYTSYLAPKSTIYRLDLHQALISIIKHWYVLLALRSTI